MFLSSTKCEEKNICEVTKSLNTGRLQVSINLLIDFAILLRAKRGRFVTKPLLFLIRLYIILLTIDYNT